MKLLALNCLKNFDGIPVPLDGVVIAYSRYHNLCNLLFYRKIDNHKGPKCHHTFDKTLLGPLCTYFAFHMTGAAFGSSCAMWKAKKFEILASAVACRYICHFQIRDASTSYRILSFDVATQIMTQKTNQHVRENVFTRFRTLLGPHVHS